ncbi:MAG: SpoIIE family protein phosphatase [Bacteroidales bacterium]|nr:SpoIIE family protein phosphatase [Bacteroidales bacterium]
MHKTIKYLLVLLLFFITKVSVSQYLKPYVENFTQKHYGDSCNAQNWSVTQDNRGILYFGNDKRLLEFDGENWDAIRTSLFGGFVSSLYTDKYGNIFVGSYGEFGKIETDSVGRNVYVSLSGNLNDEDAFFTNVWKIYEYNNSILFFTEEKIFLLRNNEISVINPETSFHLAFVVNNQLFVRQRELGLMKYSNGKFQLINNGEIFKDYGVFGIFPTKEKQKYLIITQELGAYNYYANKTDSTIIPINNNSKDKLISSNIFGGILLSDNKIALNTSQNGIIIINQNAEIENIINTSTGIKDNDIKQVYQDSNKDLWLAMNTGICRVNYSSQISHFNSNSGLTGDVFTISFFNQNLIAGTIEGLFEYNAKKQLFIKNKQFNKQIYQTKTVLNKLIISSELGLFEYNIENKLTKISNINKAKFYFLKSENLLFVAGKNNIEIYSYLNSRWNIKKKISDVFINDITEVTYNSQINDSLDFWVGTLNEGVLNIKIGKDFGVSTQNYYMSDGLNPGWITPFKTESSIVFGSVSGLLKFTEGNTLSQNNTDSAKYVYKGFFEPSNYLGLESDAINILKNTSSKVWMCKNGEIAFYDKSKNKIESINFTGIDLGKINTFYIHNSNIFIGGNEGIVYVDLNKKKDFYNKLKVNIRKVSVTGDVILYYGNNSLNNTQILDYGKNSITFNFAALYNENGSSAKYSYFVEAYDDNWSNWSNESKVKYKKLPPGKYIFKVKAKNLYGIESNTKEYKFNILPPFYRTIWAYILYVIILLIVFWLIIKLYTRKLEKDKQRLEKIIQERTREIRKQKKEITDSIHYASRIQESIIPSDEIISGILNDYFILYKPKDIVSGDFYWIGKHSNKVIIIAADCTGHGVPGAFMSMLGTAFLNEIINKENKTSPDEILNILRNNVVKALKQEGEESKSKDGMDVAILTLDTGTNKLEYAGANNPFYLIRNKELIETKANKMPVAIYLKMEPFTKHEIELQTGDSLYIFSDGFADQFGGPKGRKFMYKPFKKLLIEMQGKPMCEQKEILDKTFEDWKNDNEQIDDVLVIGVSI